MLMFLGGFLCCWLIMGALCLISDNLDWSIALFDGALSIFICLPLLIIAFPFQLIYYIAIRPWYNVWKPVEQERFDYIISLGNSKAWQIFPKVYLCFEAKAKLFNKVFFVRIKTK